MSPQSTTAVGTPGQPGQPHPLLRHRPGRHTRMPNLAAFLADNPGADPLMGNYVLLPQQDVILNFQGLSEQYTMLAFGVVGGDRPPRLQQTGGIVLGDSAPGKHMALATGDFDGDQLDEIVSLFNDQGTLRLLLARNQDPASGSQSLSAGEPVQVGCFGAGNVRVAAGHLDGKDPASFAIAWADPQNILHLEVWGTDRQLTPTRRASAATVRLTPGGNLDLAVGDFDQDGRSEIAVVWQGDANTLGQNLFMCLYHLDPSNNTLKSGPTTAVGTLGGFNRFSITAGPLSAESTAEQMAVAWSDANGHAHLQIFSCGDGGVPTATGRSYIDQTYPLTDSMRVRVTAGDLDLDGVDELVLGTVGNRAGVGALVILHVLKPDNLLNLAVQPKSIGAVMGPPNAAFAAVDFDIAVGQLGAGGFLGIVVAALGTMGFGAFAGQAQLTLGLVEVSPTLELPPAMVDGIGTLEAASTFSDAAEDPKLDLTLAMALGDFSGKSIRVGSPTYFSLASAKGILAIINAPPAEVDLNYDGGNATLSFEDRKDNQTSLSVSVSKEWGYSQDLGGNLGIPIANVTASLTRTYGHGFTKTKDSQKSFQESISTTIWQDDLIVLSVTDYDVWEYPVYSDATGHPKGYLMVVFPDPGGIRTALLPGTSEFLDYFPEHQLATLLSYPSTPPADFQSDHAIATDVVLDVGLLQESATISWNTMTTTSQQLTSHIGLSTRVTANFSKHFNFLGGIDIGLNATFSGTYDEHSMSTHSLTYTDATSITISYGALQNPEVEYLVFPYVYWSSQGGFLVVDYKIELKSTGYWLKTYGAPNVTVNRPWANIANAPDDLKELTRAVTIQQQGQGSWLLSGEVSNFTLADAYGVQVEFYDGDPKLDNAQRIGTPHIVPKVPSRGRITVSELWKPSDPDRPRRLYVILKPTPGGSPITHCRGYVNWPPPMNIGG